MILDYNRKTAVQPDVFIVYLPYLMERNRCYEPPYFVLEILSPSTILKYMTIKSSKYYSARVREY